MLALLFACGDAESGAALGSGVPAFGPVGPVGPALTGSAGAAALPPAGGGATEPVVSAPSSSESPGTPALDAPPSTEVGTAGSNRAPGSTDAGVSTGEPSAGMPPASPEPASPEPGAQPDPGAQPEPGAPEPPANVRSAGCGRGGRPAGGVVTVDGDHIYTFPPSYDGNTPLPLIFAFHANNNPIDQIRTITRGTPLEQNFVMAFPKSVGAGWVLGTDSPRLDRWYAELLDNYCIDTSRVFATGHSSGAQFIVQRLCQGESRFRAVAPVASSMYCQRWNPIDTLLIHGANDMERANTNQDADGRKDLGPYVTSNACEATTAPYATPGCNSGGNAVNPGCVSYSGCDATLIWCSHDDPNYSNTNHGWPCFANQAMFDFFSSIR